MLCYAAAQIQLSMLGWILLPILVLLAFAFVSSLLILITLFSFWTIQGHGLNYVRYQLSQFVFWPDFVFQSKIRFLLLFVLPILLVASGPVRFLINFADYHLFMAMVALQLIMSWAIIKLWKKGLQNYSSASS